MSVTIALANKPAAARTRLLLSRFGRHPALVLGTTVLTFLLLFSLAAGPVAHALGIDPETTDLLARFDPPSLHHPLGTDDAGRDELVRLMRGGQTSLSIGLAATALSLAVGLPIGLATGYCGGLLDALLMRLTDGIIALPLLPLLIALSALDLTKLGFSAEFAHSAAAGEIRLVVIIALVEWTGTARIVRAQTLSLGAREFVRAAWALGARPFHVLTRHVLPNMGGALIVTVALTIGRAILFESVLSFLGFGIVPPTPSWGGMLTNAQDLVTTAPALALYPGLLVFLTVAAVNLIGDGFQRALDPRAGARRA